MPSVTIATIFILSCIAAVTQSHGSEEHDTRIRTARIDTLGERVELKCTSRNDVTFRHWLLPDLETLTGSNVSYQGEGLVFYPSNLTILIPSVEMEHLGDYLCFVTENPSGADAVYKTTVYLYLPTIWEEYRMNFIIGVSAAAAFFVLALFLYCVNAYSWHNRNRGAKDFEANGGAELVHSYIGENAYGVGEDAYGVSEDAYGVGEAASKM